jgi:predicted metalloprotease with PDZ domain
MPPRAFEDDEQYKVLLSLAAHEVFHVWNVKRLRPAALRHVDLSRENYTDLLWFCEGTTAYYDELLVVRTGQQSHEAYLKSLAESIYQMRARPGSRVQSVAESSFDAWIKFNQPTPDDVNSTVSFYESGALVSLLLDLELRRRSRNEASLDTLMRAMYETFPATGPGFETKDLIAMADRLSSSSFEDFFQRYVYGVEAYPFESAFAAVALEMIPKDGAPKAYTGIQAQDDNNVCTVRAVLSDGPAYLAGVNPGDEIVTLNGRKFKAPDLTLHIDRTMKPGDTVWLQLLRRGRLRRVEFVLGTKPNPRWELRKMAAPSKEQAEAYASWLGTRVQA